MTTNGSKPLDKLIADFNAKIESIASKTAGDNDGMDPVTKEHLLFGKTHTLYGADRDYKPGMEQNTRKYYLSLCKNAKEQIRNNVMSSKNLADEDKTEEYIDQVMDSFIEYCKKLYLDYEQHERDTHKTVISYKDIKYINSQTGKVEKRWDLYMNELPLS